MSIPLLQRSSAGTLGYPCIKSADQAASARNTPSLTAARHCLEETLAQSEGIADAHAALGSVLKFLNRVSHDPTELESALFHANHAAELSPGSARAALSQMVAHYQASRLEMAVAAARRAVKLAPYNPDTVSAASLVIYLSGQWAEGEHLADHALQDAGVTKPVGASLVSMLDAYRTGDYLLAIRRVDEAVKPDPVAVLVKLASLKRLGRETELQNAYASAIRQYPDFDKFLLSVAESRKFEPSLAASLTEPLIDIGESVGAILGVCRAVTLFRQSARLFRSGGVRVGTRCILCLVTDRPAAARRNSPYTIKLLRKPPVNVAHSFWEA